MSNCDHIRKIQNLTVPLVKRIHRLRPKHTQWIIYVLLNNRITRGLNGTKREKPRFFYSIQPKEQNTVLRAGNRIKQVPSPINKSLYFDQRFYSAQTATCNKIQVSNSSSLIWRRKVLFYFR